ncbi:MAG: NAD(P)/FAD-dependent oxidoreductase [Acholeplasmatales bacterium]|jgi:thioredoxin reductase (NADPH)|nr:NAD(P)/FAD-dependent oxidoreductase [Acholeplasmatales bacterium]
MSENKKIYDLVIIGFGVSGIYASLNASIRNLSTLVIESLPSYGGKLTNVYKEKEIFDFPGFKRIKAEKLADNFYGQIDLENEYITVKYNEKIITIKEEDNTFILSSNKDTYFSKYILITDGGGAFTPRKIPFDYSEIYYSFQPEEFLRGKRIIVLGGGDSAVDFASFASNYATVSLIHRRNDFRSSEQTLSEVKKKVEVLTPYNLLDVERKNNVFRVTVQNTESGMVNEIEGDAIFVFYGVELAKNSYLDLERTNGLINVTSTMESSVKGIYGAGDTIYYPGKVKMIASACSEALTAVEEIAHLVYPNKSINRH